ncbi:MAG: TRAP transporter small permease [Peptococcaceae bacterium]|jgi:TRAP-type C4-dicarboxylate transport system permease small subunit|nr:TRAP transporter small permease [Peptococcaceae bacterium]
MKKKIRLMLDMIDRYAMVLLSLLFTVMVVSIFLQVVMRYVFHSGNAWAEELARYSFAWLVMIGSAIAVRRGRHMRIDFLINLFPPVFKKTVEAVLNVLLALFLVVMTLYGIRLVLLTQRQLSTGLGIPMAYAYLAIPTGGVLMLVYLLETMFNDFCGNILRGDE